MLELIAGKRRELLGTVGLFAGVFLALTLLPVDLTGPVGRFVGRALWKYLGIGSVFIPLASFGAGIMVFAKSLPLEPGKLGVLAGGFLLLVPFVIGIGAGLDHASDLPPDYLEWTTTLKLVGLVPAFMVIGVRAVVGTAGAVITALIALSAITIITLDWHPLAMPALRKRFFGSRGSRRKKGRRKQDPRDENGNTSREHSAPQRRRPERATPQGRAPAEQIELLADDDREKPAIEASEDELPPLNLLREPAREEIDAGEAELEKLADVLIDTLGTFKVEGRIVGRTTGPVVTQYEVKPAPGVKVGKISALADDLALAMRAKSIRIVAPIPGRAAVGVEVPNPTARIVTFRELIEAPEWDGTRASLPIALGRDLEGRAIIADLAKMPHLLIAGATGSGKSVCINTIITSLIYRYTPRELRMLMIDPKMVELATYNALPHLRHPVVTNNKEASQALKWAVHEMERRYELFHVNHARNLHDFNEKVLSGDKTVVGLGEEGAEKREQGAEMPPVSHLPPPYTEGPLPYVVVIVDELADLMMTVQAEVEKPLALLAQKARATGIHIILATQRPSVNVITGLIKANFPSRIAFRVASKVDSRTILDQNGAETLLGNGDMLFLPPGKSEPVRVQGAFISTEETENVTNWYRERKAVRQEEDILELVAQLEAEDESGARQAVGPEERDPLFKEAAMVCLQNQLGSTSLLQRKLRIGYGRAARIIDQLELAGVLSPPDGAKAREVLIGMDELDSL